MISIQPVELKLGGWKTVMTSDEDSSVFEECCDCEIGHATPKLALECWRNKESREDYENQSKQTSA